MTKCPICSRMVEKVFSLDEILTPEEMERFKVKQGLYPVCSACGTEMLFLALSKK